jgi:cytochrome c553
MKSVRETLCALALMLAVTPGISAQNATWQADTTLCAGCHGQHGEGSSTGAPRLAGQNAQYMSHALAMFKAGTRTSPIMQPVAQALEDADMAALAGYFSNQTAPPAAGGTPGSRQSWLAGKRLVETGPTPCFGCHGPGGKGNGARYPSIAGQPAQFLIDRLHEFQARARKATPQPGTMTAVAATMTEDQIRIYAAYLSQPQR